MSEPQNQEPAKRKFSSWVGFAAAFLLMGLVHHGLKSTHSSESEPVNGATAPVEKAAAPVAAPAPEKPSVDYSWTGFDLNSKCASMPTLKAMVAMVSNREQPTRDEMVRMVKAGTAPFPLRFPKWRYQRGPLHSLS